MDLLVGRRDIAVIADIGIKIAIMPLPLLSRDQHRQIGVIVILNIAQRCCRRYRHPDKNQDRDQGPDELNERAVAERRGRGIS